MCQLHIWTSFRNNEYSTVHFADNFDAVQMTPFVIKKTLFCLLYLQIPQYIHHTAKKSHFTKNKAFAYFKAKIINYVSFIIIMNHICSIQCHMYTYHLMSVGCVNPYIVYITIRQALSHQCVRP